MPGDPVHQSGRIVQDVLAVVDDKEQLARTEVLDDSVLDAKTLLLLQAERRRDGVRHRRTVLDRC